MPTTAINPQTLVKKPYSAINYGAGEDPEERAAILEAQKNEAYAEIERLNPEVYAAPTMDYGDLIAQALLTFGPIVGGYLADGYSGGAAGAEIGSNAAKTYTSIDSQQDAYKKALAASQLEAEQNKLRTLDESLNKIAEARGKSLEERKLLEEKRKYEEALESKQDLRDHAQALELKGMIPPKEKPPEVPLSYTPKEIEDYRIEQGLSSPEEAVKYLPKNKDEAHAKATFLYAHGQSQKPLSPQTQEKLEMAQSTIDVVDRLGPILDELEKENDPSYLTMLKAGKAPIVGDWFSQPESAAYRLMAELDKLELGFAAQENQGRPTDSDRAALAPFVSGSWRNDTPEVKRMRIQKLKEIAIRKYNRTLKMAQDRENIRAAKPIPVEGESPDPLRENGLPTNLNPYIVPGSRGVRPAPRPENYPNREAWRKDAEAFAKEMAGLSKQAQKNPYPVASE